MQYQYSVKRKVSTNTETFSFSKGQKIVFNWKSCSLSTVNARAKVVAWLNAITTYCSCGYTTSGILTESVLAHDDKVEEINGNDAHVIFSCTAVKNASYSIPKRITFSADINLSTASDWGKFNSRLNELGDAYGNYALTSCTVTFYKPTT